MKKGIIVIEDIPVICAECNFANLTQDKKCFRCDVNGKIVYSGKPDWCPIKSIPERKMCSKSICIATEEYNLRKGWNACIDEIEGKQ